MSDDGDESNSFELTISLVDGSQVTVEVKPNNTIEDVKVSLISEIERTTSEAMRWTPERMRLLYRHLQLQDDDTVEECGLRSESVIVHDDRIPSGSGTIDYTIAGKFPQGTSADWTPALEFETNTSESQSPLGHANRFHELGHHRLKSCDMCGLKDEETKWRVIEPDVSEHDMQFRISLPGEGFYECAITGLRWEIKRAITITYRYCSWSEYAPIILIKQSEFCGPLFNILAEDNIVKAIHLPHFICLKDADRNIENTFAIFYVRERSYRVHKPSTIHQTHVELQMPTFSLLGVVIDRNSWFPCHSLIMIYHTQYTDAAVLHIYVVPHDFSITQAIRRQESESILIKHPSEIKTFYIGRKYSLISSSEIQIAPHEMKFSCADMDSKQPFYEVIVREEPSSFELKLTKRKKKDPLWHISLRYQNGKVSCQEDSDEDVSQRKGSLLLKEQSLPSTSDSNASIHISDAGLTTATEMQSGAASHLSPGTRVTLGSTDADLNTEPASQLTPDAEDTLENIEGERRSESPKQLTSEMEPTETNVNLAAKPSDSSSDGEKAELALFGPSHIVAVLSFAKFDLIGSCHHMQAVDMDYDKYPIILSPPKVETPVETLCNYIIDPEDVCECLTNLDSYRDEQDSEDTCGRTTQVGSCHYKQGIMDAKGFHERTTDFGTCHRQQDPETICSDITEESFQRGFGSFSDTLQEEFLSIQKVIQALGRESAILCDKGTQTEKRSRSSKGKQKRVFCSLSTQTEVTFSDENLQAHTKLHCSIATQTDSNIRHCSRRESHREEVSVLPENGTEKESLKSESTDSVLDEENHIEESTVQSDTREENLGSQQDNSEEESQQRDRRASTDSNTGEIEIMVSSSPDNQDVEQGIIVSPDRDFQTTEEKSADSDAEMLRRDKPELIDASVQTEETRPPDDDSDKGLRTEMFGDAEEGKTTSPNNQLDKEPIQLSNVTVQTLESGEKKNLQSDASLQTEEVQRVQLDSDKKTVQEPVGVECENRLQTDIQNLPFNKCGLSDLVYFEKEQCPCKMPKVKKDKLKWTIITPSVRENENKKFGISLPEKGYYECAVTGLRWITKSQVTLTYEYCSWNAFLSDVQRECWIIGSSLFNITVQDGSVEAVYLPHFICETGSGDAMHSAVYNVACFRNNIFFLETPSEVTLSHAILRNQPLAIMGVILCQVCQVAVHAIILIYQTLRVDSSNFHVYVLPNDPALIQAVDLLENEIKSLKIQRPQIITLTYGKKYKLTSFADVTITPSDIKFCYFRFNQKQPFYEVNYPDMNYNIKLSLTEKNKITVLWELLIKPDMFKKLKKGVDFVQRHKKEIICCLKMTQPIWSQLRIKKVISIDEEREAGSHITETQQNRALVQLIMKRGEEAEEELYNVLRENDPCFVNEVECNYSDKLCNNCLKQWSLASLQEDSLSVKEINNKNGRTWLAHLVCIFSGMIVGYLIGYNLS